MACVPFGPEQVAIEITDVDGTVAVVTIDTPIGRARLIGELRFAREVLYLDKVHVEGLTPGVLGRRGLNTILRKVLVEANVERIVIQGARRTTGRYNGKIPGVIVFPHRASRRNDG